MWSRIVQIENGNTLTLTEGEKFFLKFHDVKFVDKTEDVEEGEVHLNQRGRSCVPFELLNPLLTSPEPEIPQELLPKSTLQPILDRVLKSYSLRSFLTEFSSFPTRYAFSVSGEKSSNWLFDQLNKVS
jgi:hypothetical protein